jgi:hypothetical protein
MNVNHWLLHMEHLQVGDRYRKGCPVCEMSVTSHHTDKSVADDCNFYRKAKRSGKRSIGF